MTAAYADIRARIEAACKEAGRNPSSVELIAVTKNRSVADIEKLMAAGQKNFGENRVQEALEKYAARPKDIRVHFIGHLQSNKAGDAVALFDMIHSIDRISLAEAVAKEMQKQNRPLPCFIQVNTGEEEQKGGVAPKDLEALFRFCRDNINMDVRGLMCIPPADDLPELHFALLHKLAASLGLSSLSMGMSADFETAIRYGATHIRIGNALF